MLSSLRDHAPLIRRALRRRRRLLAVLVLFAAVTLSLPRLLPAPADTVTIVLTRRDLPAGQQITAADVTTQQIRTTMSDLPVEDPSAVIGRRSTVDVPAGAALHSWMLTTAEQSLVPEGWVLMAVTVDPALSPYLHAGTAIGLVVPNTTSAPSAAAAHDRATSTTEGIVITPPKAQVSTGREVTPRQEQPSRTIVAVPRDAAGDLSHSAAQSWLTVFVVD